MSYQKAEYTTETGVQTLLDVQPTKRVTVAVDAGATDVYDIVGTFVKDGTQHTLIADQSGDIAKTTRDAVGIVEIGINIKTNNSSSLSLEVTNPREV